jgi:hypothetical protein
LKWITVYLDHQREKSEPPAHGSTLAFLALAGVLEIALLVVAVVILGVAYTFGLHFAILLFATAIAVGGFWKWKAGRK